MPLSQILTGDQLLTLTERGAAVLLALAILMACLAAILYLVYSDRRDTRKMEQARLDTAKAEKEADAEDKRTLALTSTLSTVVTANSETTDAIRELAKAMKDSNDLSRRSMDQQVTDRENDERMARELAAMALDTVMSKLATIEGKLHGPVMVKQLEELKGDVVTIKKILIPSLPETVPSADGEAHLLSSPDDPPIPFIKKDTKPLPPPPPEDKI